MFPFSRNTTIIKDVFYLPRRPRRLKNSSNHGYDVLEGVRRPHRQEGCAHPDGGARRGGEDDDPVQVETRRSQTHDANPRFQRGERAV